MGAIQQLMSSFGPTGPTDPFWTSVTSLTHMEGANGGTTFIDQKPISWTRTPSSVTSTAQFKFGSASMLVSGGMINSTTALSASGFGTGDFTIEGWFYATATTTRGLFDARLISSPATIAAGWDQANTRWQIYFDGTIYNSSATSITLNTWQHFALVRNGTSCVFYVGGVSIIAFSSGANVTFPQLNYGRYYNNSFPWVGYIDECRVTKGVARYTSAFSPPTAAFPDS